ncbi:hypothetical protein NQZ68_012581 [Dissostichus eleginoides]|nr:hypothetical protein NQZ68_012581 [Dissostichus eleginoides]
MTDIEMSPIHIMDLARPEVVEVRGRRLQQMRGGAVQKERQRRYRTPEDRLMKLTAG